MTRTLSNSIANIFIISILLINFQIISAQTNDTTALRGYLEQAVQSMSINEYEKAYHYCQKAIALEPKCGDAYILMGNSFIKSIDFCSDGLFEEGMIYCLAVDMYEKAKTIDSTATKRANKLITIYSRYFPSREEIFIDIAEGERYKVGCWIQRETTVRFVED